MVIRADDLLNWLDDSISWQWGLRANGGYGDSADNNIKTEDKQRTTTNTNDEHPELAMRSLKHSQVDFSEVDAEKGVFLWR